MRTSLPKPGDISVIVVSTFAVCGPRPASRGCSAIRFTSLPVEFRSHSLCVAAGLPFAIQLCRCRRHQFWWSSVGSLLWVSYEIIFGNFECGPLDIPEPMGSLPCFEGVPSGH
ncbi:unnamed protein product [Citrullus colocynthis]|uniref:Uncharacterized protein n=1 Tax=Citrullus colocynthis TaxID=252529 RepID=A0ABP0Y212_9ROSI